MLGRFHYLPKQCQIVSAAIAAWVCGACGALENGGVAELVLRNGAVYTVNADQPWAQAVAVSDGRIVEVGSNDDVGRWTGAETRVVDLEGNMLLSGFGDSHVHPVDGGIRLGECNLNGLYSQEEVLEEIGNCAARGGPDDWIIGRGWFLWLFPDGNPHKSLLDEIAPGRPMYLTPNWGHNAWVSSRALQIAGVDKDTPDPLNGRIERDPVTGEPTGVLREWAAGLVGEHLPDSGHVNRVEGLRRALGLANRFGITMLQDASVSRERLEVYAELDDQGELRARVVASLGVNLVEGAEDLPRLTALREEFVSERLRATAAKIFADGILENYTSPLLDPYSDRPGYYGEPHLQPDKLEELVAALDAAGFQVHVHALGDAAIRMTLDAFEQARSVNGLRDSRHHISHTELVHPDDVPRFRELGVIANFQPMWAQTDPHIVELTMPKLGPERTSWLYPIRSIVDSGARIAFGSDWWATSLNPLDNIQVAVTRSRFATNLRPGDTPLPELDGSGPSWIPGERVDLETAIAAYTLDVAYLGFQEDDTGSIEVGKYADFAVLDRNLFEIPSNKIHQAKVLLTLLEGESVYEDPAWTW